MADPNIKTLPTTVAVHAAMKRLAVERSTPLYKLTELACVRLLKQYGIDPAEVKKTMARKPPTLIRE